MRALLVLLVCLSMSSCADNEFFQEDALATAQELKGKAAAGPDSAWVIAGRHYDRSGFHRFFWGDHNRALWAEPVKLPIFKLDSLHGGLRVVEKGGGFQTTSFDLLDSTGRRYAFRSVDKDPVDVVSPFWRKTFVANVLRDQTAAANPYGALVVPPLSEAVGVYHSNPRLYYVPASDTSFGAYAEAVRGKVFLFQEKYEAPADITPVFRNVLAFQDSEDVLRKRFSYNTHHVNQRAFARARLLDLLIGDWDRHKGQWEWAVTAKGADTVYVPVPKDRDQVFFNMKNGLVPSIANSKLFARKLHAFDDDFSDVKAYMINGAYINNRFLNELTLQDWQTIAREMQQQLTDTKIEQAVRRLPPTIYALAGKEITHNLKSRRDLLPKAATEVYKLLAAEVTVVGSDMKEIFTVRRLENARVEVTVERRATNTLPARQLYKRTFHRGETKQIILHGLDGEDTFTVSGAVDESIPVKIYGGLGEDKITDTSTVTGLKDYTLVYDTDRGNDILFGSETRDMTTDDVRVHAYDREGN